MSSGDRINDEYDKSSEFVDVIFLNNYLLGHFSKDFFIKFVTESRHKDVLTCDI
jgi:hypothetical protein